MKKYYVYFKNKIKSFILESFSDYEDYSYLIIDKKNDKYIIEIRSTRGSNFKIDIESLVKNKRVLFNLPPNQSAFIGKEYHWYRIKMESDKLYMESSNFNLNDVMYLDSKNGKYKITGLDRFENIKYVDKKDENEEEKKFDPRDTCLTKFIEEFDPSQAFYIGYQAAAKSRTHQKMSNKNVVSLESILQKKESLTHQKMLNRNIVSLESILQKKESRRKSNDR